MKTLLKAVWVPCPGIVSEGEFAHSMRDYCWSCAPYWGRVPTCPNCKASLKDTKRGTTPTRRRCPNGCGFISLKN